MAYCLVHICVYIHERTQWAVIARETAVRAAPIKWESAYTTLTVVSDPLPNGHS